MSSNEAPHRDADALAREMDHPGAQQLLAAHALARLAGPSSVSMVSATCGRADRARTLGETGTVQTMICAPFQWNPMGITLGKPSDPV